MAGSNIQEAFQSVFRAQKDILILSNAALAGSHSGKRGDFKLFRADAMPLSEMKQSGHSHSSV